MVQVVETTAAVVVKTQNVIQLMDPVWRDVHRATGEVSATNVCNT
jgi:hypothetical protein